MSEIALYRKYRPKEFTEVVGQDHVKSVLLGAIKNERITHAYLFSGGRGSGKTSVARLFAKELGVLASDIYEMDAASNRGIDEVRELREGVATLPLESPYKVYIIDEVHMLTTPAFNALLKTLEEPPAHVIFILATTELHKLPDTIISRCQSFTFKKPTDDEIKQVLSSIAKGEKCTIDKDSLNLITLLGEGSFRDAIGIFQKVISVSKDKKIAIEEVEKITNAPATKSVEKFVLTILDRDMDSALKVLSEVGNANIDMKLFTKMVMRLVRFAMLISLSPDMKDIIDTETTEEEREFLNKITSHEKVRTLPAILKELLITYEEIGNTYIKQLPLELAVAKIIGVENKEE